MADIIPSIFLYQMAGECLNLLVITGTNRDMIIETSQVSPCWARGQTFMEDIKTAKLANNFFNFRRGLKTVLPLTPHPLKIIQKFQWLPNGHIETTVFPDLILQHYEEIKHIHYSQSVIIVAQIILSSTLVLCYHCSLTLTGKVIWNNWHFHILILNF